MKQYILFLFVIALPIYSQWNGIPEIPKSSPIYCIYNDGDIAVACADTVIYISNDKGGTWIKSNRIGKTVEGISSAIQYEGRIFVGTDNSGVYESTDGGKTWTRLLNGLYGLGSETITKMAVRDDRLYAGTAGAGIFAMDLKDSPEWVPFSEGLYSLVSYTINELKNIDGNLFVGAGLTPSYYLNEKNSSRWEEINLSPANSLMVYDIEKKDQHVFVSTGLGLYTSSDGGKTFSFTNHKIGATMNSNIVMNGSLPLMFYTKFGRTIWFSSEDNGTTLKKIEDQYGFEVLSSAIIGNKLFAGRAEGLWCRPLISTDIEKDKLPNSFSLLQNFPNPFNPVTVISYQLPVKSQISLKVYDVLGNEIATLVNENQPAGTYRVNFNGKFLASGMYICKINAGNNSQTKKMMLVK